MVEHYSTASDMLTPFVASADDTIQGSVKAVLAGFASLSDLAKEVRSESDKFNNRLGNSLSYVDFITQQQEKREKIWASMESDGIQPILKKIVKNPDHTPPTLTIPNSKRFDLEKLLYIVLADAAPSGAGRPMIFIEEIYKTMTGHDAERMPRPLEQPRNETALLSNATADQALSQKDLPTAIEAVLQDGFHKGAKADTSGATQAFYLAESRINELTDPAVKAKYLNSLAFYQNNAGLYDDALQTTRQITDPQAQVDHYMAIAENKARKDPSSARQIYQEAANCTMSIQDSAARDKSLASISFYQNMSRFPDDALATAQRISSTEVREKAIQGIRK